jgi:HK97 family phage portal protein
MSVFYAIRNFFRGPGAPTRDVGTQTNQPNYAVSAAAEVSTDTALQVSAVWRAVRIIAEAVGSMPFDIYETGDKLAPADGLDVRNLLRQKPNQYQTSVEFWESVVLNLALSGNAYVIIQRLGSGRITGLLPVSSAQVETQLLPDGTVVHAYTSGADVRVYSSESMWHIKLFGNGIVGMSPLSYARNSIGIAQAADNRVGAMYSNGAKPSGVLTIDKTLTDEQRKQIKSNYKEMSSGNDDRLFVLEASMSYQQISMTPKDMELIDARRFQIEDVGRFFGVPSILLNQTFGQSSLGSNVYEIMSAFYKLDLRPYLEKIEASIKCWLIDAKDFDKYEPRFDFDALLRSDTLTRMQAYREAINSGQMMPNEARSAEGRPPVDGGDQLLIQGAMVPIMQAGQKINTTPIGGNDET